MMAKAKAKSLSALVSFNAFKGTLSNEEASHITCQALSREGITARALPIGDGGLGTWRAVHETLGGEISKLTVAGPMQLPAEVWTLCLPNAKSPRILYLESPLACGHALVPPESRDVMRASSAGLGEWLIQADKRWANSVEEIYIGLGDSAVSDMGIGMLSKLGFRFFDGGGRPVWPDANGLRLIRSLEPPKELPFSKARVTVLCDVLNPICGPRGSARVFAKQKGASDAQVILIEEGMENFSSVIQSYMGRSLSNEPMTGSAGGLGAAFLAFLGARLVPGASCLLDWIGFDAILSEHSFIVTGEGRTDEQTLAGKAPLELMKRSQLAGRRCIMISGALGPGSERIAEKFPHARLFACGQAPSAKKALATKVTELFTVGGEAKRFIG